MADHINNDALDSAIKGALKDVEVSYDAAEWEGLEKKLETVNHVQNSIKKWKFVTSPAMYVGAGALIIIIVLIIIVVNSNGPTNQQQPTTTPNTPPVTNTTPTPAPDTTTQAPVTDTTQNVQPQQTPPTTPSVSNKQQNQNPVQPQQTMQQPTHNVMPNKVKKAAQKTEKKDTASTKAIAQKDTTKTKKSTVDTSKNFDFMKAAGDSAGNPLRVKTQATSGDTAKSKTKKKETAKTSKKDSLKKAATPAPTKADSTGK